MMRTQLLITAIVCVTSPLALAENRPKWRPVELAREIDASDQAPTGVRAKEYVRSTAVDSIDLDISPGNGRLPEDVAASAFAAQGAFEHHGAFHRDDILMPPLQTQYQRVAPWIAYNPLYFDDPRLERDGYHFGCVEPIVSAARFYGRIPLWPYMIGATHPRDCVYSLGQGRPGDCRPYHETLPKHSARGVAYQAAAVTSGALLLP